MTREQLEQLRFLSKEIHLIEDQIKEIKYEVVSDTVKGSGGFPYVYHTIPIVGIDIKGHGKKVKRLKDKLLKRKAELINLVCEINEYINGVKDSEIRQIIILRYINGLTWDAIAIHLGYADESVPRKKMDRYLK